MYFSHVAFHVQTGPHAPPQVILVGATLKDDQISLASTAGWINDHVSIRVGKEDSVPSSLRHRWGLLHQWNHPEAVDPLMIRGSRSTHKT